MLQNKWIFRVIDFRFLYLLLFTYITFFLYAAQFYCHHKIIHFCSVFSILIRWTECAVSVKNKLSISLKIITCYNPRKISKNIFVHCETLAFHQLVFIFPTIFNIWSSNLGRTIFSRFPKTIKRPTQKLIFVIHCEFVLKVLNFGSRFCFAIFW